MIGSLASAAVGADLAQTRPNPSSPGIITSRQHQIGPPRRAPRKGRHAVGDRFAPRSGRPRGGGHSRACRRCRRPRGCARCCRHRPGIVAGSSNIDISAPGRPRPGLAALGQPAQRFFDIRLARRVPSRRVGRPASQPIGRQMGPAERDRDGEGAARDRDALDIDRAAVQLDQLLHQREADAGAFMGAAARALDAVEALEEARELCRGNAGAGVADGSTAVARRRWLQRGPRSRPRR